MDTLDDRAKGAASVVAAPPPTLRFLFFGHARVLADGEVFHMATPRKTLPVLAYLLLNRGATIARSFLSYLIWPDETEEAARAKLRATLYDLVRVLPPAPEGHWVVVDGANVRWNQEAQVSVDVGDFETALADSDRLEHAVELYDGDFLEALYDEWMVAPRERYRSAYLGALEQLITVCRGKLAFGKAIAYARRLLEADPLREDVARRLIALRYEAGDRAGALEEFDRFEQRIRDELDIDPMPETVALRDAIVRHDAAPADDGTAHDVIEAAPAKATLPFVGRRAEMEQVRDAWSRAARGRGGVFFIGGDPGVGKSRLVAELAREVEEHGGRVIFGATGSPESIPYQAFIESLRSALPLLASSKLEGVWLATVASLLPELSTKIVDIPALANIDPENERARLFGALVRAFVALAQPRPLLVVLEDLHWAQEATIAALAFIARRVALAPVLVVATYRDNETAGRHPLRRARVEATLEGAARNLSLRPLSLEDVEHLARQLPLTGSRSAVALHQASGGSPLLLAAILNDPDQQLDRPAAVVDVIRDQLERLSPGARSVAEVAALVGPRFSRDVVRDVGGWDATTFGDALDELIDRRIVRETTGRGVLDYAFAHQTLCDVVAAAAPPERMQDRHRRIARKLEALHPELAGEFAADLGRHYEIAADKDAAAAHYHTAAQRAFDVAAIDEAMKYVERGLGLASSHVLRKKLLIERGRISQRAGDHAALGSAAEELAALAEVTRDREAAMHAALLNVQVATAAQDDAQHRSALDLLRDLTTEARDPQWRATYLLEEARAAYGHTELDVLQEAAQAALTAARECDDAASAARALSWLAEVETNRGNFDVAQSLLEQMQSEAVKAQDGAVELDSLRASFMVAYNRADVDRTVSIAQQWLERGVALGDRYGEASGRLRVAISLVTTRHDVARIREELTRARAIFEELHWQRGIAGVLLNQGILENEIANFAEAARITERALEIFVALDDARGRSTALTNLATIHAEIGDGQRAYREAEESIRVAHDGGLRPAEALGMENLALAAAASGEIAEAIELGENALAKHEELGSRSRSVRLIGDLAIWYATLGDLTSARARVDEMLPLAAHIWAEWPQRFHWAAAQILRATGDGARAHEELHLARDLVASLAAELRGEELERYLSASWNAAIIRAHDADEWPALSAGQD